MFLSMFWGIISRLIYTQFLFKRLLKNLRKIKPQWGQARGLFKPSRQSPANPYKLSLLVVKKTAYKNIAI